MNVTTCRTKAHTGEELLHKIMDGVAHTREHPEIIQRVVNSCEISSSHGGEYDVQSCLLGYTAV
jgi:hypothetical protein